MLRISSHGTHIGAALRSCTPYSAHDDSVEGCYGWCAQANVTSHCVRCKCRACSMCYDPQDRRGSDRSGRSSDAPPAELLVIFRGEAFRDGSRATRTLTADPLTELAVLQTIKEHALKPARLLGYNVTIVADVTVPPHYHRRFAQVLRGDLGASAVRFRPLSSTQTASLLETMQWAAVATSRAVLLVRADVELKVDLALPPPSAIGWAVLVPFRVPPSLAMLRDYLDATENKMSEAEAEVKLALVADAVHFVPRNRLSDFMQMLAAHNQSASIHMLCQWLAGGGVSFWDGSVYQADSCLETNALYRQVWGCNSMPCTSHPPLKSRFGPQPALNPQRPTAGPHLGRRLVRVRRSRPCPSSVAQVGRPQGGLKPTTSGLKNFTPCSCAPRGSLLNSIATRRLPPLAGHASEQQLRGRYCHVDTAARASGIRTVLSTWTLKHASLTNVSTKLRHRCRAE